MSHIPNSAMPHAGPAHHDKSVTAEGQETAQRGRVGRLADSARANPAKAAAAGAAVVAGVLAAAAIPIVRARRNAEGSAEGTRSRKSSKEA